MGRWGAPWPGTAYFIGVGGVAMSSLAVLLREQGVRVTGSDRALYPPSSEMLHEHGIAVSTPFAAQNLDPDTDLVVVGNAVSRGNPELERALELGLPLCSLPELVERLLVPGRRVTAVAGTHGKTTTASLIAHLHVATGREPSFVIGGRPGNFSSGARVGRGEDLVLEADEYDSAFFDKGPKFLHYWPRIAVLHAVEFDHADIYADLAAVERAFSWFVRLVPEGGTLCVDASAEGAVRLAEAARCKVLRFGPGTELDLGYEERVDDTRGQVMRLFREGRELGRMRVSLPGEHNARNALAALLAFEAAGGELGEGARQLATFAPPARRLEVIASAGDIVVYDDFAHHPTAVGGTLSTMRGLRPESGRVVALLEPRSNTMVRRLSQERLGEALALADVVRIAPVDRPERFLDSERLDVAALATELAARGVDAEGPVSPEDMAAWAAEALRPGDRVVVMSNGGFGGLPARLAALVGGRP